MPLPFVVLIVIVASIVMAVPLRRLRLSGYSSGAIAVYAVALIVLALAVTELRPLARYLLPLLGLLYVAPFITWRGGLDRLLGRRPAEVHMHPAQTKAIEPPRDAVPRDAVPRDVTPRDAVPSDVTPRDAVPSDGTPSDRTDE